MVCCVSDGEVAVGGEKKINAKKSVEVGVSGHGDCLDEQDEEKELGKILFSGLGSQLEGCTV